ncbi:hypothetical protein GCM10010420_44110 [Streptomyces glaucosporus]|uniref:Integral membrane protein n=1 Tax=Streptomyces glaucosporus TaxID=284044 RepID=A0ABN3IPX2_9ACTN
MTVGGCSRALRAAVFAAVCVLLAAVGHTAASGSAVPRWVLAAGAVAAGGTAWCLAGRERSPSGVAVFSVSLQTVLHWAFVLAQAVSREPHPAVHTAAAGHGTGGASPFGMPAVHLAAALVCGMWLARGERAFFRILRSVAGWLAAPLRPPGRPCPPSPRLVRLRPAGSNAVPPLLLLAHTLVSRGPPAGPAGG